MTFEEFDKIVDRLHKLEKDICATKGKEYSNSDDRLANFKRVGTELAISPLSVAYVYLKKHLDSISFATKTSDTLSESFESRILDARTYLALLYALYIEMQEEKILKDSPAMANSKPGALVIYDPALDIFTDAILPKK